MPWGVRKRGRKWQVYNTVTGKSKGSHPTKKKAEAHRRALYANVPESRRKKKTKKRRR